MRCLKGGPIRVGDKTTGGGVVTGPGVMVMPIHGVPVAVRGDIAICCGSPQTFVEGCHSVDYDGRGVVLEGHKLSCGHHAISSCATQYWIEDHGPVGSPAAMAAPAASTAPVRTAQAGDPPHWLDLHLSDRGEPLPGQPYVVTDSTGRVLQGRLDERGCARVSPVAAGPCRVDFPDVGYSATVQA